MLQAFILLVHKVTTHRHINITITTVHQARAALVEISADMISQAKAGSR